MIHPKIECVSMHKQCYKAYRSNRHDPFEGHRFWVTRHLEWAWVEGNGVVIGAIDSNVGSTQLGWEQVTRYDHAIFENACQFIKNKSKFTHNVD